MPVHGGSQAYTGGSDRGQAVDLVQGQKVHLPHFCHQSQNLSLASLSVLQTQSHHRKKQPGIPLRLPHGRNPHRQLNCQCDLLSDSSLCRRSHPLVQEALPSHGTTLSNTGYHSYRPFNFACQPGKAWNRERSDHAQGLSLPQRVHGGFLEHPQVATT